MADDEDKVAKVETVPDGSEKIHTKRAAYQNLARRVSSAAYMDAQRAVRRFTAHFDEDNYEIPPSTISSEDYKQYLSTSEHTEDAKKKLKALLEAFSLKMRSVRA